jgi:maleylacetoacetate isomerase
MIKMYGFWRSAASFRVRIALNLKGLAYEEEMIDLDAQEQYAPAYVAKNAQASVPTLFFDDQPPMTQSLAILEYLEERHPEPALLPNDVQGRARVRAVALIFAADHHPLIVPRVRRYLTERLNISDEARTDWIRYWFREGLRQAEVRLGTEPDTGRFCHGDNPTIADLCLVSQVAGAKGFQVDISDMPTVSRIAAACLEIPAFARAHPLNQPGAPTSH